MAATLEQVNYRLRNKLQECEDALEGETLKRTELESANKELTDEIRTQKAEYLKIEKHSKDCEKATGKAQKEAKDTKGRSDRLISTLKDQLKNAERRYEEAARDLKKWRDKYGNSVEAPANEKHDLQVKISEWQSKAENARNEIISLEEQIQGTPEQIGLHQALEQWEEHQGCSEEFASLEDKVHDGMLRQQKLESDLTASRQRYNRAKLDINALQTKVDQLEQVNKAMKTQIKSNDYLQDNQQLVAELRTSREQLQKTEEDTKALQDTVDQSRAAGENDVDMLDESRLAKELLEEELKAFQERHQTTLGELWVLEGKVDQLEKANKAYQDNDKIRTQMLQKLESDQQAHREQYQEIESNKTALQEHADQLESTLRTTREQQQTTQSNMEKLQETAEELDLALKTEKEQHGTTKTNMGVVQGKADRLELELKTVIDQCQASKSDTAALQGKVDQLESDLRDTEERCQTAKTSMEALKEKADQLDSALRAEKQQHETTKPITELPSPLFTSLYLPHNKSQPVQEKSDQFELDLQTRIDLYQALKADMDVLQGKMNQLKSDIKNAEEQYQTAKSTMEALPTVHGSANQSDLDPQTKKDQDQASKLDLEVLQGKMNQLKSDLNNTEKQYQTAKLTMEALPKAHEKFSELDLDRQTRIKEYQASKSDLGVLQEKVNQLESDLKTTEERYQTTKSTMEALREKADQLEQESKVFQELENQRLQTVASEKKEQDGKGDSEVAVADDMPQDMAERVNPIKPQQLQFENPTEAEYSQVTPPSSQSYTTDDSSRDLEKTPRPTKSLRQELGYSSQEHSDEEVFDEEHDASAESSDKYDSEDAGEPADGIKRRWKKKLFQVEQRANTREKRAKVILMDPSELFHSLYPCRSAKAGAIASLFECTPAKADAIDLRLMALGPGCLTQEAPAVVAHELSGIPEDTYKGLASGQLIATVPPKEVKDVGTDPEIFAADVATDTADLPVAKVGSDMATDTADLPIEGPILVAEDRATDTADLPIEGSLVIAQDVATDTADLPIKGPLLIAQDMATDTADLPIERPLLITNDSATDTANLPAQGLPASDKTFTYWDLVLCLLVSMIACSGLFGFYAGLRPEPEPTAPRGILHKHVFSHRHTAFPTTPSLNASTPITLLYPPTPALHFGLPTMMMKGGSLDRGLQRSRR